jgi:hypothetical protein
VRHKGKILGTAPLHFQGALRGIGLQGQTDRMVEYPVDNVERLSLQRQPVFVSQIVDTPAQDAVLRYDLFDIKSIFKALETMNGRAFFAECLGDGLIRVRSECRNQFVKQPRHMVVQRGDIQVACGRELPHLLPPTRQQRLAFLLDDARQFVQVVDRYFVFHFALSLGGENGVTIKLSGVCTHMIAAERNNATPARLGSQMQKNPRRATKEHEELSVSDATWSVANQLLFFVLLRGPSWMK